jgi:phosphinothricin acetyltransferase
MIIRPARRDDFASIAAITNHYIAVSSIHFGYVPVSPDELAEKWTPDHPWLVVEEPPGTVIGYAKAGVWRERAAYRWTCETGLYLAEDARGRGVGGALYAALLAECEHRGFRSAISGITLPNPASVALHHRLGFESVGVVRDAGFKHEAWHDVEFFQKRFVITTRGDLTNPARS